jgi:uncharacterized membrane protein
MSVEDFLAKLDSEFQGTRSGLSSKEEAQRRTTRDRSLIARLIVWLYVAAVSFVILVVMAIFAYVAHLNVTTPLTTADWKELVAGLVNILSVTVLPVVTLVLGFYFGTQAQEDSKK